MVFYSPYYSPNCFRKFSIFFLSRQVDGHSLLFGWGLFLFKFAYSAPFHRTLFFGFRGSQFSSKVNRSSDVLLFSGGFVLNLMNKHSRGMLLPILLAKWFCEISFFFKVNRPTDILFFWEGLVHFLNSRGRRLSIVRFLWF